MSLQLCVLGSGSGGNCSYIEASAGRDVASPRRWLIDAGLSPRQTNRRLRMLGASLSDITDILITHPDTDHLHPNMVRRAEKLGIRLHVHSSHMLLAFRGHERPTGCCAFVRSFERDGVSVQTTRLAHDDHGSIAYRIECGGAAVGYATDLGHVPEHLFDLFDGVDGLAIESNYDRAMQLASARPTFLKRRIMNGHGHLSNEESLDAVVTMSERANLRYVALLHLSQQCNCPMVIDRLYRKRAPHLHASLTISNQHTPTAMLDCRQSAPASMDGQAAKGASGASPDRSGQQNTPVQPSLFH